MATVGTGTYTYELVEDWAKLPAGWTLGQTGIVTDARDRVYLFNRSVHPLIVLDRDGTFFTSWGEGVLSSAHGMFIDQQENIYLPVIQTPPDLVVDQWSADVESGSQRALRCLHERRTMVGHLISHEIRSAISTA